MSERKTTSIRIDPDVLDRLDAMVEGSEYENRTEYLNSMIEQHVYEGSVLSYSDREAIEIAVERLSLAREIIGDTTDSLSDTTGLEVSEE